MAEQIDNTTFKDFDNWYNDKKIHINLSYDAWNVIKLDASNFSSNEKEVSVPYLLNTIITNFYNTADATISKRVLELRNKLNDIFTIDDLEVKDKIINKILDLEITKLINKANSYEKGEGSKFRLNSSNITLLSTKIFEGQNYNNSLRNYLKALFEEYSLLPTYMREQIFFKDTIDNINSAINAKKKLTLKLDKTYDKNTKSYVNNKYRVTPYKICQDRTNTYNYLLCLSREMYGYDEYGEEKITSFRIDRIVQSRVSSIQSVLSKDEKATMDREIKEKNIQYVTGDLIKVKVRFNKKGLDLYRRIKYQRPNRMVETDIKDVYEFECTYMQAKNYFFNFDSSVEILEPKKLRDEFIRRYTFALKEYEKE